MTNQNDNPVSPASSRSLHIIAVIVLVIATVGYLAGTRSKPAKQLSVISDKSDVKEGQIPQAVTYNKVATAQLGPNAKWSNTMSNLKATAPSVLATVVINPGEKEEAMANRTALRAFHGAPPLIPHPVNQITAANCVICHGQGKKIGNKIAPKISHLDYVNCTQCHVEKANPSLELRNIWATNSFEGLEIPTEGKRAWPGAPPVMPHSLWMRNDCTSCHGILAKPGLKTTHPWRHNCLQCHAPSAELDHRAFVSPFDDVSAPTKTTIEKIN